MRRFVVLVYVGASALACAAAHPRVPSNTPPNVRLAFAPESDSFRLAAREYDSLWPVVDELLQMNVGSAEPPGV